MGDEFVSYGTHQRRHSSKAMKQQKYILTIRLFVGNFILRFRRENGACPMLNASVSGANKSDTYTQRDEFNE